MRPLITAFITVLLLCIMLILNVKTSAQCPDGHPGGSTAFDTTIATPAGITNRIVKFPQFDPSHGMVSCVRLCISITAVVDTMYVENTSASNQTAYVDYIRN